MEKKEKKGMRKILLLFFFVIFPLLLDFSLAIEPVITVSKHEIELTMIPDSTTYGRFFIYTAGGDENVELSLKVVGNVSNWIKLSQTNITLPPNSSQEVSLKVTVPDVKEDEYLGKVIIYSKEGQIEEINLRVKVLEHGGRFKVECSSERGVVRDFSVLIYAGSHLVDSGTSIGGVFLSNYLPYGEYRIRISSEGYYDAEKTFLLNKEEQVASFRLRELEEIKLTVIPEKMIVKFCSGEEGTASLKLVNSADYPIPVRINSTSTGIKVEENNFTVPASSSKEIWVKFDFPKGNYSEKLYVSHEDTIDEIEVEITSIPPEECKAEFAFSILGRDSIKLAPNYTSILVIYINPYEDLEKVRVKEESKNLGVEIYPLMYQRVKSGDKKPFLIRIKPIANFTTSLTLDILSSIGEKTFSVKLYRSEKLDRAEIEKEIKELKDLIKDLKTEVLDISAKVKEEESDEIKAISLKLSDFSVKLDVAKTALDSNPGVSKSYVEDISLELGNILNKFSEYEKSEEVNWYLYLYIGIAATIIGLTALIVKRKFFT
ncbi:hypothetical protein DRN63_00280 [Nanoarchaeota archaeon]|nr:MAG: hypothetical protein DRN63_00280 [Nanoarchaeota archaeon]